MTRPFRFAVQLAEASSRKDWIRQARLAEELGYSVCVMPDHFGEQLAPFTGLMAMAEATESIRIGTFVLDNDFRHPLVTAYEAATLNLLTEGRLELGLGAGWLGNDYSRSGIHLDSPGIRVERLEESVRILKSFFAGQTFSFSGSHYTVTDVEPSPTATQ